MHLHKTEAVVIIARDVRLLLYITKYSKGQKMLNLSNWSPNLFQEKLQFSML
jgi:hypothetical protein